MTETKTTIATQTADTTRQNPTVTEGLVQTSVERILVLNRILQRNPVPDMDGTIYVSDHDFTDRPRRFIRRELTDQLLDCYEAKGATPQVQQAIRHQIFELLPPRNPRIKKG